MRISTKGRYALASMIHIAHRHESNEPVTISSISNALGISKIYLEQVFFLLKRNYLVRSVKGAQGGYRLAREPRQITALDIFSAVELSLFEATQESVDEKAMDIEAAMRVLVYEPLDKALRQSLEKATLEDLVIEAGKHRGGQEIMFYI